MSRSLLLPASLAIVLVALPGCGTDAPAGPDLPSPAELVPGEWNEIVPGGDTICSRGEPYAFWVRPGTTDRVIVDFIGGGACWDEFTCSVADAIFSDRVDGVRASVEAAEQHGIYDHENADNPFADYWHVIVPYCTGDIHWGNSRTTYGTGENEITINHRGAVNARAVLDWVYRGFESPEQILVTGCSAGSYGAALWSSHVMRHYPGTRVIQFGDSGAGIITDEFFRNSFPSWHADEVFPSWIAALDPARVDLFTLALPDLYVGIADEYPANHLSQYNTALDDNQTFYFTAMGGSGVDEWSTRMQSSVADIEARAPNFSSYLASGQQHCIIPYDNFYTVDVGGRRLVDWLRDLEQGTSTDSVACSGEACSAPTP
ncbi:MAG: pectinacetylesterase family protein [Myxococcota bacterium]|nr:pectinacetylesterase family protein [Myxococcota bacterium]